MPSLDSRFLSRKGEVMRIPGFQIVPHGGVGWRDGQVAWFLGSYSHHHTLSPQVSSHVCIWHFHTRFSSGQHFIALSGCKYSVRRIPWLLSDSRLPGTPAVHVFVKAELWTKGEMAQAWCFSSVYSPPPPNTGIYLAFVCAQCLAGYWLAQVKSTSSVFNLIVCVILQIWEKTNLDHSFKVV